ncbi:Metalloenzyme, LuxS/M16 peptidase-like protein [Epithele typhae]|uniref:Metalloenzyme, LuxS/M16 peptidase-like protein n=1 Tax=Epithele typhae TaxID=378194 RepID=UPI0020075C7E|nr:Metalloenzyme, LuxS/M16 peptidase-like protein [Epithele typhae]KAH9944050.1 Metalloenzyme, LuxS/M16 peptidase-like protein [Epithele typhae]
MPSLANHASQNLSTSDTYGNFDLIKRFKVDHTDIHVSKWKSRASGLSVVHLDYDAPLVNGYFVVGTEIFNDSGCPHTLEHLVFMGSDKYPYKGIIDHLANRGFSNGTNAWTDTDHTAYTVSTAGEQGFLQLLPIYVDHILYPTLTKAGFVTEVHHVDGKGEDSGVVYSEMQGRENTSGDLMALRTQRLLNHSKSAYRSETGGLMEALRVLTVEQIRDYHHSYYVPHNLTLIVAGKLASGTESLLNVVQNQVEPSIAAHGQNQGPKPVGWKRPFVETPSADRKPIAATIKETVEFPEKDESVGELVIGFRGPPPTEFLERQALDMLGDYLTSSPVAPLNKEYVEIENPMCTYIYFSEDTRATSTDLPVYIGSVPTEHLDTFDEKLKASLKRIADTGIDMERMAMIIARDERQLRSRIEASGGDVFAGYVITDSLYGAENGSDLPPSLNEISQYAELKKWTGQQWSDLLRKYYVDPPRVVVRGKPSGEMADRLDREDKARIAAQQERLGPDGLAACERELEAAKKEHEQEIPQEILTSFPVPDVKSIAWIPVQSVQEKHGQKGRASASATNSTELAKHVDSDGAPLPFFVQYDHVKSDFVTVHAYFSLANLPNRLRPLMTVYLSAFFSLPVKRSSGEHLNHEEVVHRLDSDTVSYEVALGVSNTFTETMRVSIKVDQPLYETAVTWLKDLVYGGEFNKERLQVNIAKIQQSLPEMKRDGDTVLNSVSSEVLYDESSTSRMGSIVPQMDFIPKLAQQLQESPEKVLKDFEEIRKHLTDPSGVRVSVNGNILELKNPRSVWAKHFGQTLPETELAPLRLAVDTLSPVGKNPVKKAVVVSLPTIESAFVTHTTKGIQGWAHPEYPAIRVAVEVLNATESYLWRYIRGSGLAYGAHCGLDLEAGFVTFSLYRSSNSMEAFKQAASVMKGLTDGSIALDETVLDAAKSSIVFNVAKGVSTPSRAAIMSFTNQGLKGVSQNHNVELLEKFQAVTKEDVLSALQKHFLPLFDSASSVAVVVTAPGKADQVSEELGKIGFEVERKTLQVEADEDSEFDSDEDGSSDGESDGGR